MCDTFVALPALTQDHSIIFGKNSDREANEAQQLEYHPRKSYDPGSLVKCTYLTIPQVNETNAVLLSRPFWMWGAEIGANEHHVVIGNEAVFTKMPVRKTDALTGMDLIRLALERCSTATEAKDTIVELIAQYGQGGIGGYQDKSFSYHNSFLIADQHEAWVLETAGPYWVTKKVSTYYAISNGLTIEDDYDAIHPQAIAIAHRKKWIKKEFGFASAYSDWLYTRFSDCKIRRQQAIDHLEATGDFSLQDGFDHLRSHRNEPYRPDRHLLSNSICAHAGNKLTRHASQTTGSLLAHLTPDNPTYWCTAASSPCISTYIPVWFEDRVLPDLGPTAGAYFDMDNYWWQCELIHRMVLSDYQQRGAYASAVRKALQDSLFRMANEGPRFLTTELGFGRSINWTLIRQLYIREPLKQRNWLYSKYWDRLNRMAKIPKEHEAYEKAR